jgi:hypothetical protein
VRSIPTDCGALLAEGPCKPVNAAGKPQAVEVEWMLISDQAANCDYFLQS